MIDFEAAYTGKIGPLGAPGVDAHLDEDDHNALLSAMLMNMDDEAFCCLITGETMRREAGLAVADASVSFRVGAHVVKTAAELGVKPDQIEAHLVHGKTPEERDANMRAKIKQLQEEGRLPKDIGGI